MSDVGGTIRVRRGTITRNTQETSIVLSIDLDGHGEVDLDTGIGFFDHMLHHVAVHGLFDLVVKAQGDLYIDAHHTVEDVSIAIGQVIDDALGDRRGIRRMGEATVPMDEALARVVVDLSGRPYSVIDAAFTSPMVGQMPTSLVIHSLESIATHARMNLHAQVLYGRDDHHKAEALYKALGRALDQATQLDSRRAHIPSTKGTLTA
ncbi:MAG: imidazoleglycerol-phosphate dehydratase HisB [Chloroflexi bacterium]|nr:imidazoleglycerol-phosphate dehydratase HisB [Chloroflexota bacterium]